MPSRALQVADSVYATSTAEDDATLGEILHLAVNKAFVEFPTLAELAEVPEMVEVLAAGDHADATVTHAMPMEHADLLDEATEGIPAPEGREATDDTEATEAMDCAGELTEGGAGDAEETAAAESAEEETGDEAVQARPSKMAKLGLAAAAAGPAATPAATSGLSAKAPAPTPLPQCSAAAAAAAAPAAAPPPSAQRGRKSIFSAAEKQWIASQCRVFWSGAMVCEAPTLSYLKEDIALKGMAEGRFQKRVDPDDKEEWKRFYEAVRTVAKSWTLHAALHGDSE